jgi:hypothetical protein
MPEHGSRYRRRLCLASCRNFLRHHTAGRSLGVSTAGGKVEHTKGDDALRLKPDLPGFYTERHPRIVDCRFSLFVLAAESPEGFRHRGYLRTQSPNAHDAGEMK